MSASERLRELGPPFDLTETHSWIEYDDGVTREIGSMVKLYDALPLIADVVEAAEREQARDLMLMAEGLPQNPVTEDYERWRQSDEARARDYALTALREALEEK